MELGDGPLARASRVAREAAKLAGSPSPLPGYRETCDTARQQYSETVIPTGQPHHLVPHNLRRLRSAHSDPLDI